MTYNEYRLNMNNNATLLAAVIILSGSRIATAAQPLAAALQPFVDEHNLAGAVTLIASEDKVLDIETVGWADIAARKPMRPDTMFWIASMSKPITTAALMMLVDEGKVNVDDPVVKYLPEFKDVWLEAEKDQDHILLKRPAHTITVKNILSHTSGLQPTAPSEKPTLDLLPLASAVRVYATTPLMFEPGTQYRYANAGINTAGRIIEVVSGMAYEKFLQTRLFDPLEMKDTTFWPNQQQIRRLAKSYKPNRKEMALEETPVTQLHYPLDDHQSRYPMPAGGLFSTAGDMAKFCQMILNNGSFNRKRLLSEAAVRQATSVETGDILINGNGATGYGFGWVVNKKQSADGRSAASFGHNGAYKTAMWIDPPRHRIFILMRQHAGDFLSDNGKRIEPVFYQTAIQQFSN